MCTRPKAAESIDSGDEGTSTLPSLRDLDEEEYASRESRYKLSLEVIDDLLKAIYMIQEEKVELSVHDKMCKGLAKTKHRVFSVHRVPSTQLKKE